MAAGDVTKLLLAELGLIMEDASADVMTESMKLTFLNKAQRQLCNFVHDGYLTELEDVAYDQSLTDQALSLTALNAGNGVLRGAKGIKRVRVYIGGVGNGAWATEINVDELKKMENQLLVYSDTEPKFYIFENKIKVLVNTFTGTTIDVYFLKMPAVMTPSVDPEINETLHGIMVSLTESRLWAMDNKPERRDSAFNNALREIETLNSRYQRAEGIGTKGREREK